MICHLLLTVLAQVEIAEREQELIKGIELVRQKMVESTAKAAQRIIELNDELAELEVCITTNLIKKYREISSTALLSPSTNGDF